MRTWVCVILTCIGIVLPAVAGDGSMPNPDSGVAAVPENASPLERAAAWGHDSKPAGSASSASPNMVPPLPLFQPMNTQRPAAGFASSTPPQQPAAFPQFLPSASILSPAGTPAAPAPSPPWLSSSKPDLNIALSALDYVHFTLMKLFQTGGQDQCESHSFDVTLWRKCTCMNPATYSSDGRGNCNLGASKLDDKVWCYVDTKFGPPPTVCPDAQLSTSKPGFYWSRLACIT